MPINPDDSIAAWRVSKRIGKQLLETADKLDLVQQGYYSRDNENNYSQDDDMELRRFIESLRKFASIFQSDRYVRGICCSTLRD